MAKTEKFGFVYIWRDRKHNRYYIGSHWGTEDDGYICSSNWMRDAFRRRPDDFKRRILTRIYTDRIDLLEKEQQWMNLIRQEEIGKRYYNLTKSTKTAPWYLTENDKKKSIKQRMSESLKAKYQNDPEWAEARKKHMSEIGKLGLSKETQFKQGQEAHNKGAVGEQVAWNKGLSGDQIPWVGKARPEEVKKKISETQKGRIGSPMSGRHHSEESRKKSSDSNKGLKRSEETRAKLQAHHAGRKWWNNGIQIKRQAECPGEGWVSGKKLQQSLQG